MKSIRYRKAERSDIQGMAMIRALDSGTETHWATRITNYLDCNISLQQALEPRVIYVALHDNKIIGFIAGHLTERFQCDGELQWLNVVPAFQRKGIAIKLISVLCEWFAEKGAFRVCIDPGSPESKAFYLHRGATALNEHWLVWPNINLLIERST